MAFLWLWGGEGVAVGSTTPPPPPTSETSSAYRAPPAVSLAYTCLRASHPGPRAPPGAFCSNAARCSGASRRPPKRLKVVAETRSYGDQICPSLPARWELAVHHLQGLQLRFACLRGGRLLSPPGPPPPCPAPPHPASAAWCLRGFGVHGAPPVL
ncbi:unnamed protein product [Rangifer tarandus platyrhynchus]|uniref:Uncharacterized protein n=1 Tax=Rangifer tarandus platyrhynchus TaxID=3082113 RepID=A0AC59ZKL1_RANTA